MTRSATVRGAQLKLQRERGTDVTIFSPRASTMAHHIGKEATSIEWSQICNDLIARVVGLYPKNFVGVCMLPQSPGVPPANSARELERCVTELGFIGANLNPDPSGGHWTAPSDDGMVSLYENSWRWTCLQWCSESSAPIPRHRRAYINDDTPRHALNRGNVQRCPDVAATAAGGGAVTYPGEAIAACADMKRPRDPHVMNKVFFDTGLSQPGIDLLLKVLPSRNPVRVGNVEPCAHRPRRAVL